MENRPYAFTVGLFVLLLGVAIAVGAAFLNRERSAKSVPFELLTSGSVQGLNRDAAVRFRGVDIGRVRSINFDSRKAGQIRIVISVDPHAPITHGTFGQLNFQGITGLSFLQLNDDGNDQRPLESSPEEMAQIELRPSLFETAEDILRDSLTKADRLAGQLEHLLNDENQQRVMAMLDSIRETGTRYRDTASHVEPALDALPGVLKDTQTALRTAEATFAHADHAVDDIARAASNLDRKLEVFDSFNTAVKQLQYIGNDFATQTLPRVNQLTDEAAVGAGEASNLLTLIGDRPDSVLFGEPERRPGPGEPGFQARPGASR